MYKAGLLYIVNEHELYLTIVYFKTVTIILLIDSVVRKYGPLPMLYIQSRRMSLHLIVLDAGLVIWS